MISKLQKVIFSVIMIICLCVFMSCKSNNFVDLNNYNKKYIWPENGETGYIKVNGGEVFYRLYGKEKKGIPIIFVHGGPGSSCNLFYPLMSLSEERPLLFFNQLGSAGTKYEEGMTKDKSHEFMTIDNFVDQVDKVVKYFNFDNFILYGQSWGTMLSLEYAYAKKPENLKGIILSGPFLSTKLWIMDAERLIISLPDGNDKWAYVESIIEKSKTNKNIIYFWRI